MNQTLDPVFRNALRHELTALPGARPRSFKLPAFIVGVVGLVVVGGAAMAGLLPPGQAATAPLAPPVILNGIGPATVPMPPAPDGAAYLRVELACFEATRCFTLGGGIEGPGERTLVQRDALPLTDDIDPTNPQSLDTTDPTGGVVIDVDAGTHWRLYAVYTDGLSPEPAPVSNGLTLGIPSNGIVPDLVPAVATNGEAGWVSYSLLLTEAQPRLTPEGASQPPIPVYDEDGMTVIGEADVSRSYR
jgi:hypothetical protein